MNAEHFTIGFIGLGLIGGSIAKTIRRVHPDTVIYGFDTDREAGELACQEGVLNQFFDAVDSRF